MQLYLDDLPIWGFVGKAEPVPGSKDVRTYLFTHMHFDIQYNGPHIIEVGVTDERGQRLYSGTEGTFRDTRAPAI